MIKFPNSARDIDQLGVEQKKFEAIKTDILMPRIPIIARLDGKAFHTFTKNLKKPFDLDLQACMKETLVALCEKYNADLGYSQSDEITLVWYNADEKKMIFDGRRDKYMSLLASAGTLAFYKAILKHLPSKADDFPQFDCRVFQVPSRADVFNNILWRWLDARKNSVSMLASSVFREKELLNKSTKDRKEMLLTKGYDWNTYPEDCKSGYFCKKITYYKKVTCDEKHRVNISPETSVEMDNGDIYVCRKRYDIVDVPSLYVVSPSYTPDNFVDGKYDSDKTRISEVFSESIIMTTKFE